MLLGSSLYLVLAFQSTHKYTLEQAHNTYTRKGHVLCEAAAHVHDRKRVASYNKISTKVTEVLGTAGYSKLTRHA